MNSDELKVGTYVALNYPYYNALGYIANVRETYFDVRWLEANAVLKRTTYAIESSSFFTVLSENEAILWLLADMAEGSR